MALENKTIVIIVYKFSVVVKGIEKMLGDLGYDVVTVSEGFENIGRYTENAGLFMMYLPGDIMDDPLRMRIIENNVETIKNSGKGMLFIGEEKFHDDLSNMLPAINGYAWMDRPIAKEKLFEVLEELGKTGGKPAAKKRILIVDDDPSYAKMVREWIKSDFRVDIVTAGMQAISFLLKVPAEEQVNLILLDYEMPVVDGPQVLQMLRQDSATMHIPVVFLTGLGTKEAVSRVMELKPEGYILKSTTREALLGYLHEKLKK